MTQLLERPRTGQLFKHRKGSTYRILAIARIETTLQKVVVYQAADADTYPETWVRPLAEFMDGRFQPAEATKIIETITFKFDNQEQQQRFHERLAGDA